MVTYNYSVSKQGPMPEIQEALNAVVAELSVANVQITSDITINVGPGTYKAFRIREGSLLPLLNSVYRLIIKPSGNHFPVIDFNLGSESTVIGADIGTGNPNVTIQGLRFKYFAVGVRAGTNSHFVKIRNCIFDNNRNTGIFVEQCDETQITQNIVINGDYGIVARLCKSIVVIHNTVFMNGAISNNEGKSISGLWLQLALDYGGGIADTGTLYILGNIVWNITGRCLTLFYEDVERAGALVSDFNDLVSGDTRDYIGLQRLSFLPRGNPRPATRFNTLREWKLTGFDQNSINQDPRFISSVRVRTDLNGYAIDLNILPVSPVLGIVPSFFVDLNARAEFLPSFFDSADLATDIIGLNRSQAGTAAGANDKASTFGFYGQDIFSNPLELNIEKDCAVDPLLNILNKELDIWYPKLKPGYFYSHEREYYLYGKKEGKFIGEIAVTEFNLFQSVNANLSIELFVRGKKIEEPEKYVTTLGTKLFLFHKDLTIYSPEHEIEISLFSNHWKDNEFSPVETTYVFKIKEGTTRYLLPHNYKPKGPVVVTDDASYPTDSDYYSNREFTISFNEQFSQPELTFVNASNRVTNAQFEYGLGSPPSEWESSDSIVTFGTNPSYTAFGTFCCAVHPTGYIAQTQSMSSGETALSWHAYNKGSGEIKYKLDFFDANSNNLGYTQTGYIKPTDNWERYYLLISDKPDPHADLVDDVPYNVNYIGRINPPTNVTDIRFEFEHQAHPVFTGAVLMDGVQLEDGYRPTLFNRNHYFAELTVEYETSNDDFVDRRLAIAPVRNLASEGFIYIPEVSLKEYEGPDVNYVSTLHEWRWPHGRIAVLPWSRTKGKDKLRKRTENDTHRLPQKKPDMIHPVTRRAYLDYARLTPTEPLARQGDPNGIGVTLQVIDSNGNPHSNQTCNVYIGTPKYNFPGYLHTRFFGLKEELGQNIIARTNNVGLINFIWVPPPLEQTRLVTDVPTPSSSSAVGQLSSIQTPYPVNLDYHGNVTILNSSGEPIPTAGTNPIEAVYKPSFSQDVSRVKLKYPIKPGSVQVKNQGNLLKNSISNQLETGQFFIDYENSTINVKGKVDELEISYIPSYVFINQTDTHRINFYHDLVFGSYSGPITVGYDLVVTFTALINDNFPGAFVTEVFNLVAQNPLLSETKKINTHYLEI